MKAYRFTLAASMLFGLLAVPYFAYGQEAVAADPQVDAGRKTEIKVFAVEHASAIEIEQVVRQLIGLPDRSGRSGVFAQGGRSRATLRTSVHEATNSLLINGPADDIEVIRGIIAVLDVPAAKKPKPGRGDAVRKFQQQLQQRTKSTTKSSSTPGILKWVKKGNWATLLRTDGAFQIRVLTEEQKAKAEQAVAAYQKQREAYINYQRSVLSRRGRGGGQDDPDAKQPERPAKVERPTIATDLARSDFYRIVDANADYVELKGNGAHLLVPATSIHLILIGETGTLDRTTAPSAFGSGGIGGFRGSSTRSSPEDFRRALRGRDGRSRPDDGSKE